MTTILSSDDYDPEELAAAGIHEQAVPWGEGAWWDDPEYAWSLDSDSLVLDSDLAVLDEDDGSSSSEWDDDESEAE